MTHHDSGDYTWEGGGLADTPKGYDPRTCAERHDQVLAMLSRRVDRLEQQVAALAKTINEWQTDGR